MFHEAWKVSGSGNTRSWPLCHKRLISSGGRSTIWLLTNNSGSAHMWTAPLFRFVRHGELHFSIESQTSSTESFIAWLRWLHSRSALRPASRASSFRRWLLHFATGGAGRADLSADHFSGATATVTLSIFKIDVP